MLPPDNIILNRTTSSLPEQYDAFDLQHRLIGFLRIRHGVFTVEAPDIGGAVVYMAKVSECSCCFADNERIEFLAKARVALSEFYTAKKR